MKKPYFLERSLPYRIEEYIGSHEYVDIEEMTDYLMTNYKEFRGKNKRALMKGVEKAYKWVCHQQDEDNPSSQGELAAVISENMDVVEVIDLDVDSSSNENLYEKAPNVENNCGGASVNYVPLGSSDILSPKLPKIMTEDPKRRLQVASKKFDSMNESPKLAKLKRKSNVDNIIEDTIKKKKSTQIIPVNADITFADVAGFEKYKEVIIGLLSPLKKSLLITGPTGCGKTSFVRAISGTSSIPIMNVIATDLIGSPSESQVQGAVDQMISWSPCILLIEKIDVIAQKEGNVKSLEKRISAQLCSCLADLKTKSKDKQVLLVAETSHPENLDWDLRNSFDEEIFLGLLSEEAREHILKMVCSKRNLTVDCSVLSHMTPGFVAGDLVKVVEKAESISWKRNKKELFAVNEEMNLHDEMQLFLEFLSENVVKEDLASQVMMDDFMEAVSQVTPVLKKEGFPTIPDITWDNIGGLEHIKKELKEKILDPIKYQQLHEEFGAKRPNGILMWGPPGCGKTLLAKAVANEAGINLLPIMGPELLNMSGSKSTIVNTLLTEMNGFTQREDVYVIAATNRPDILDPAITRPGRFDTLLYVDLPDHPSRVSIFKACTKNGSCPLLADDVNFDELARLCDNYSGADCDHLVYLASKEAIREVINENHNEIQTTCQRKVYWNHFKTALKNLKPSVPEQEKQRYARLKLKIDGRPTKEIEFNENE